MNEERYKEALKCMVAYECEGKAYQLWVIAFMELVRKTDLSMDQILNQLDHITDI